MRGFGINFYGFFVFSAVWISAYALWVRGVNARERSGEQLERRGKHDA